MRGLPRILMVDRGAATASDIAKRVFERLGVKLEIAQQPRAKGSVERKIWDWQQQFASGMRLEEAISFEQLFTAAIDFAVVDCATRASSRHKACPSELYNYTIANPRVPETALVELPELLEDSATFIRLGTSEPVTRQVDGAGLMKFEGREYLLPAETFGRRKVEVSYNLVDHPAVSVRLVDSQLANRLVVWPSERNQFGYFEGDPIIGAEFRSHKKSPQQDTRDLVDQMSKELIKSGGLKIFTEASKSLEKSYVRRQGEEFEVESPESTPLISREAARAKIREMLGRDFTPSDRAYMAKALADSLVPMDVVDAAAEHLQNSAGAPVISMPGSGTAGS